jgi:hypothetical protein
MFRFLLFSVISSAMLLAAAPQPAQFRRPLVFEPNRGQAPAHVKWLARGPGYQLLLTTEGMTMVVKESATEGEPKYSAVRIKLDGGRPWNHVTGLEPTGGVSNYLRSDDVNDSLTGIPHYGRITVGGVYEGVDLVFYSHDGALEYDFLVKPDADPKKIHLMFEGQQWMRVDDSGDLVLTTAGGRQIRQLRPNVYQQAGTKRVPVAGNYELLSGGRAAFALAAYNRRLPLVIDPTVTFVQTFGSSQYEYINASAVDSVGNMYVAGGTGSHNYPVTDGSRWLECDHDFLGFCAAAQNSLVTKISPVGVVLFATYAGPGPGGARGIAVDPTGVYVTGSFGLPESDSQIIGYGGGISDLYIVKLSPTGVPIYRNTIGGSEQDGGNAIAVDSQHNAWIAGVTRSRDMHQGLNGQARVLIAKFDPTGHRVASATYGGNGHATANAIALDAADQPWVTGQTCGPGFPLTGGIFDANGSCHVFVMQLERFTGTSRMVMAFGGSDTGDSGLAIVPNGSNTAYITGVTNGRTFPVTAGAYMTVNLSTGPVPFVTQVDATTPVGRIIRSTYLGGNGNATASAISIHPPDGIYDGIYVGGTTSPAPSSGFLAKLSMNLTQLYYYRPLMATTTAVTAVKPRGTTGAPVIYVAGDTSTSDGYVMTLSDDFVESQVLWHNATTGQLSAWSVNAQGTVTSVQTLSAQCSAASGCSQSWKVAGALDANRDGVGDVLLHNASTGELQTWLLNSAGTVTGIQTLPRRCGTSDGCSQVWKIVGLGDFNHDRIQDLLWHSESSGELQAWLRTDAGGILGTMTLSKRCAVGDGCWTTWKIIGIGDFNQDGIDDLFWQNLSTGAVQMSLLNGSGGVTGTRTLAKKCGPLDGCVTTWKAAGMVDVNRDGILDLLWQNTTTGELQGWLLNGMDRILGTQSLSLRCDAASGCTPSTIPVGILRAVVMP